MSELANNGGLRQLREKKDTKLAFRGFLHSIIMPENGKEEILIENSACIFGEYLDIHQDFSWVLDEY